MIYINTSDNTWNNSKNISKLVTKLHWNMVTTMEYSKWSLVTRSSCRCMMLKSIKSTVLCTISSYDNTAIIQ